MSRNRSAPNSSKKTAAAVVMSELIKCHLHFCRDSRLIIFYPIFLFPLANIRFSFVQLIG